MPKLPADQIQYWVRNEQGRTWGPYSIPVLARMRGQLTGRCEVALDGKNFRPSSEFPELKDLLSATREVMAPIDQPKAGPRISAAMAAAFGIKDGKLQPLGKSDEAEEGAPPGAGAKAVPPAAALPKIVRPAVAPKSVPPVGAPQSGPPVPSRTPAPPPAAPMSVPPVAPKSVPPVGAPQSGPPAPSRTPAPPPAVPKSVPPVAPKSVPPVSASSVAPGAPATPTRATPAPTSAAPAPAAPAQASGPAAGAPARPPEDSPHKLPDKGDLAQLSPVRLYGLAALSSASGWLQLELESGRMLTLSFRRGVPEHLASDDPELSVLRFLQKAGTLTPAQGIAAEEHARRAGVDVVSALFALQLIPPSDAARLLSDHAHFLLDHALLCWRGNFSFEKDAPPPPGSFPLGQRWTLLAESIRRLDHAPLRARLGRRLQWPILKSGGLGIGRIEELALNAQESRLYSSIDGTRTGDELIKAQDAAQTLRLLFLLTELSHLSFAEGAEPAEPPPPKSVAPSTASGPAAQANPGKAAPAPAPGQRPAAPPGAAAAPARGPKPPAPPAPPRAAPPVMAAAKPLSTMTIASGPKDETPEAQLQRLTALHAKIASANHFEALGVARTAAAAEVKRIFFLLARELHPDTVVDLSQEKLRALKEALFARVNEAAQVLGDEKRRKEYEAELDGSASRVDVARIFAAEEAFQKAEILIKARKYQEGLDLLEEAIVLNDQEAEFHAWHGYAKFLLAKDRKSAYAECVAECKRALKLVKVCVPAYLLMGHMAKAIGELKTAEAAYHRVLELDEKNIEAQRELRVMGKK
jgi:DnaJ domain